MYMHTLFIGILAVSYGNGIKIKLGMFKEYE
jgi:hypothetical protein